MKNLSSQDLGRVSGGECWITGDEKSPVLVVTNESVVTCGNIKFYSDHMTVEGHTVWVLKKSGVNSGGKLSAQPYYDMSGNRIGSIYKS